MQWKLQAVEAAAVRGRVVPRLRRHAHATFPRSIWFRGRGQDLRIVVRTVPTSRPGTNHSHFWIAGVQSNEAERKRSTKFIAVLHAMKIPDGKSSSMQRVGEAQIFASMANGHTKSKMMLLWRHKKCKEKSVLLPLWKNVLRRMRSYNRKFRNTKAGSCSKVTM